MIGRPKTPKINQSDNFNLTHDADQDTHFPRERGEYPFPLLGVGVGKDHQGLVPKAPALLNPTMAHQKNQY